jgi:hypothetical protein
MKSLAARPWYVAAGGELGHRLRFVPFAVLHMHKPKPLKLDYLWAALCILGAVYFVFRSPGTT